MWVLPVPGGPSSATLLAVAAPCRARNGRVARSRTLPGVEVGLEREVEVLEGLVVGQPRQLQGRPQSSSFAESEFLAEQQVDEVAVAHGVGLGASDEVFEVLSEVREPETGGVVVDAGGHQFTHAAPTSSPMLAGVAAAGAVVFASPARTS